MRIVFLGSGAFAGPAFEALLDRGHDVAALVTQPDRAKGRGRAMTPPPLKPLAESRGVAVLQPARIRHPEAVELLRGLRPEILVVVAYGQILPKPVLELAPRGAVNVHASLLPRYRGAAPIQWAIVGGEPETGVTTMLLDEGLDTGPILLQRATPMEPGETARTLEPRLARLGAELLIETLAGLESGSLGPTPQDAARATLAPIIQKDDGRIDWRLPATDIARRVRGFDPWPGTWTFYAGRLVKVLEAAAVEGTAEAEPGQIVEVRTDNLRVACGGGSLLELRQLQPESRRPMSAGAFAAGARVGTAARFG
jgi:methionyl-tRNA formyltransferase